MQFRKANEFLNKLMILYVSRIMLIFKNGLKKYFIFECLNGTGTHSPITGVIYCIYMEMNLCL